MMKQVITLLLLLPLFALSQSATPKYGENPAAGHRAKIRGINMYYEVYGEGQPLLIIHGNSGSIGDFSAQIPYFSKNYKVIVADSRDHGQTLDTLHMDDSLTYEMMSDDYAALLTSLNIDSAYVLGWSDGGINGLLLAMRHPEKVKKLAITGANLWPDTMAVEPLIITRFTGIRNYYQKLNQTKKTVESQVLLRHFNLMLDQPHISPDQLKKIQCPTLVMAGDHDVIRVPHTVLIAQSIPKSTLWIAPDAGHGLPVFKHKDKFNAQVDEFFKTPYKPITGQALFNN
ncbi:MAG: alpha/beta hydrolase [Chitinophagaceae bacterium]